MTAEETAKKLQELSELIVRNIPSTAQEIAIQTKSFIQERIQENGLNYQEESLTPYSVRYKKVRQKKGLQTDHVDLTVNGAGGMWFGTKIKAEGYEGGNYVVTIGGGDGFTQDKLNWNSERYGDILQPSHQEETKMSQLVDDKLVELINEIGL